MTVTGPGPLRVIYLGGLGRSGSTLVERLLAELPGVCSVGEVVHMWQRGVVEDERCGCGEPFSGCGFWRDVGQAAFGGWARLDAGRVAELRGVVDRTRHIPLLAAPVLPPRVRRDLDEYLGYYTRVYPAITEVSGCPIVVDSSKHASLAFCLRRQPGLDLRVIHVVRDSRAVAYSWTKRVSRPDSAAASYMTTYTPARAAGHWNVQNQALQLLARTGTPTLRVRYEDLVTAPADTLARIADFAGLPAGGPALRFLTGRIAIRGDERWRSAMPASQRRTVTALTFPLLAHYGYTGRAA